MIRINAPLPKRPTAIYLSHGGGPLPVLGDPGHTEMVEHLEYIAQSIDRPPAIVVVSAHWEEPVATITAHSSPAMIYDYYGFPEESYSLQYPVSGDPDLASEIHSLLERSGIAARLDGERGIDHGLYIPLMLMYPKADIPCVQLSLLASLNAEEHIRIGSALAGLRRKGVMIIGSGFSFHNLHALLRPDSPGPDTQNGAFEDWLIATCSDASLDESGRTARLTRWEDAPSARYCHPREEHLLPLHVCYGATKRACSAYAELTIMNKKASTFFW